MEVKSTENLCFRNMTKQKKSTRGGHLRQIYIKRTVVFALRGCTSYFSLCMLVMQHSTLLKLTIYVILAFKSIKGNVCFLKSMRTAV